jgi:ankyrin repeat protein
MHACISGKTEIVKVLLDAGVDVRDRDLLLMTALLHAAFHLRDDIVEILLAHGANPRDVNHVRRSLSLQLLAYAAVGRDHGRGACASDSHVPPCCYALAISGVKVLWSWLATGVPSAPKTSRHAASALST